MRIMNQEAYDLMPLVGDLLEAAVADHAVIRELAATLKAQSRLTQETPITPLYSQWLKDRENPNV